MGTDTAGDRVSSTPPASPPIRDGERTAPPSGDQPPWVAAFSARLDSLERATAILRSQAMHPATVIDVADAAGATPSATEDARTGYLAAVQLWVYAGQVIWERFNAMLVANSIVLLAIVYCLTGSHRLDVAGVGLSAAGLVLCVLWYPTMRRSYDYQRYYAASATEQELRLGGVATAERGRAFANGDEVVLVVPPRRGGTPVAHRQRLSYVSRLVPRGRSSNCVVLIFALSYVLLLIEALHS